MSVERYLYFNWHRGKMQWEPSNGQPPYKVHLKLNVAVELPLNEDMSIKRTPFAVPFFTPEMRTPSSLLIRTPHLAPRLNAASSVHLQ